MPNNGIWKFYLDIYIYNSGMRDINTQTSVSISLTNKNMYFESDSFSSQASKKRRSLAKTQTTIVKNAFYSKETDVVHFSSIVVYDTSGDTSKLPSSLGKIQIDVGYYDFSFTAQEISFSSYDAYSATLDKYYFSVMQRSTFILFVIFCVWCFLHSIFLVLQVRFNIISLIIKKIKAKKILDHPQEAQMTKMNEDDIIHIKETMDANFTTFDRSLKDSVTRSQIELIPKINQEVNSASAFKNIEEVGHEDSGEI